MIPSKPSSLLCHCLVCLGILAACQNPNQSDTNNWIIQTQEQWAQAVLGSTNISIEKGQAKSTEPASTFSSIVRSYPDLRQVKSITFSQTNAWDNWHEIPKVGHPAMDDAPVFIPVRDSEYWLLARYRPESMGPAKIGNKRIKDKRHKSEQGYHAYHSSDMKTWEHKGPVSGLRERWVTTAEYVDGKFYIYYDHPNDQDPHLIIDNDLTDGKMGQDIGMVFNDPSHGSDCAILHDDTDNQFHLIYENWDPINARKHSWDSPLAGRAVSPDGIQDFQITNNVVDHRTRPTGSFGEYKHSSRNVPLKYEIHEPEQNAYGDWTAIKIGGQYYLFCDYDPAGDYIRVGRFTSSSLDREFEFVGEFGKGHPDPTVGFAEGEFYLIRQRADTDFKSPGPWVGGVEARVGVDTTADGKINQWLPWQAIKESYQQKPGYIRVIETAPASMNLSHLPAGYGFSFEYRTRAVDGQTVKVVMENIVVEFDEKE